jgi:hypothetical protein
MKGIKLTIRHRNPFQLAWDLAMLGLTAKVETPQGETTLSKLRTWEQAIGGKVIIAPYPLPGQPPKEARSYVFSSVNLPDFLDWLDDVVCWYTITGG